MMEVTFRYDEDALAALVRQTPWRQRFESLIWTFAYILAGMAAGSILPLLLGFWIALAVCWGVFLCLVLFVLYHLAVKKPGGGIDLSQLHPITMRLDEVSWQTANPLLRSRDDWSKLSLVKATNEHLFIFVEGITAFVIPVAAFASGRQAEEFAAFARRRIEDAQPPAGNDPPWPVADPDLRGREESAEVIRGWFTPTLKELEQEEFRPPATKEMAKSLSVILVCIGVLVLVFNGVNSHAAWHMLCAAAGIMSLALAVIGSFVHQRRRWRKRLPAHRLQRTQLAASPRGISLLSSTHESHITWQAYSALTRTSQAFVLAGRRPNIDKLTIPLRAFASAQDVARFEALARAHIKA